MSKEEEIISKVQSITTNLQNELDRADWSDEDELDEIEESIRNASKDLLDLAMDKIGKLPPPNLSQGGSGSNSRSSPNKISNLRLEELERENRELKAMKEDMIRVIDRRNEEFDSISSDNARLKEELQTLQSNNQDLRAQVEELREKVREAPSTQPVEYNLPDHSGSGRIEDPRQTVEKNNQYIRQKRKILKTNLNKYNELQKDLNSLNNVSENIDKARKKSRRKREQELKKKLDELEERREELRQNQELERKKRRQNKQKKEFKDTYNARKAFANDDSFAINRNSFAFSTEIAEQKANLHRSEDAGSEDDSSGEDGSKDENQVDSEAITLKKKIGHSKMRQQKSKKKKREPSQVIGEVDEEEDSIDSSNEDDDAMNLDRTHQDSSNEGSAEEEQSEVVEEKKKRRSGPVELNIEDHEFRKVSGVLNSGNDALVIHKDSQNFVVVQYNEKLHRLGIVQVFYDKNEIKMEERHSLSDSRLGSVLDGVCLRDRYYFYIKEHGIHSIDVAKGDEDDEDLVLERMKSFEKCGLEKRVKYSKLYQGSSMRVAGDRERNIIINIDGRIMHSVEIKNNEISKTFEVLSLESTRIVQFEVFGDDKDKVAVVLSNNTVLILDVDFKKQEVECSYENSLNETKGLFPAMAISENGKDIIIALSTHKKSRAEKLMYFKYKRGKMDLHSVESISNLQTDLICNVKFVEGITDRKIFVAFTNRSVSQMFVFEILKDGKIQKLEEETVDGKAIKPRKIRIVDGAVVLIKGSRINLIKFF